MNTQSIRPSRLRLGWLTLASVLVALGIRSAGAGAPDEERFFAPPETVTQFQRDGRAPRLPEAGSLIRVAQARQQFNVDGSGLAAAVLDTGIYPTHQDFPAGKILEQHNYTDDNASNDTNALDGHGHGTNVAGIILANGPTGTGGHTGIAPGAKVVAMKVLPNQGQGSSLWLESALQYLINNHTRLNITVANLSLGTTENLRDAPQNDSVRTKIAQLRQEKVAVVISAGNSFGFFGSAQGMAWPAVIPESVSVGAVYDAAFSGTYSYGSGVQAGPIVAGQICPFSQRLHPSVDASTATDIFAPGAALTSTGIVSTTASSSMHGTSQAAPVTAGVILLMQQYHLRQTGQLPTIDNLERWLRSGAVQINDGDDEVDSVTNTGLNFLRIDALGALQAVSADLSGEYSLSGRITTNGMGLSGVAVTAGATTVQTNSSGDYTIGGLAAGTYTVTPAKTPYTFTPANQQVNLQANTSNVNFTAVIPTFTVSGTIRVGGNPLSGVSVSGAGQTVTTNGSGVYTLLNVTPGTYTITPSRSNYSFTPANLSVTVTNANVTGRDFAATLDTYSLSGAVTYQGQGVEGVTLTLTGGTTTTTNALGQYSFPGLLAGNYTITPSKAKTAFSPVNRMVTVGPSAADLDFTGTPQYQISGTVRKDGLPLAGVLVTIPGRATTTSSNGTYNLINLEPGTYTVVPSLTGHVFTPAQQQVVLANDDQSGVDFSAALQTYTISGRVTRAGVGVVAVLLTLTGGETATTDADGNFTFSGISAGTHTLTPSKAGHSFSPTSLNVAVGSPGNAVDRNFTATLIQYTVSGIVRAKGSPLAGARVSAGERSALTTSNGAYTLTGLTIGTYTVTPFKLGCRFAPVATEVTVGPDRAGVNFDGVAVPAVSGKVTLNKTGLPGVTLTLASPAGTRTTTTATDGTYGFNDVAAATHTLTPSLAGHLLTPGSRRVRITKNPVSGQNFAAAVIPDLDTLVLAAASVKAGRTTTATVTVNGKAPAALRILLHADNTEAVLVPKSVTIPRGRTSARFTLRTKKVSTPTLVTISATLDGITRTATLTVSP